MVKLALLWHMHQPYYEDRATGEHILPWVRLHAIKDYWGMVALLREFPRVRLTFNLVPSLIAQVEAFASDRARDRHLAIGLKPAAALTPDEARWLIANGFHAPYARMIGPYPRYAELYTRRHDGRVFGEADLRDLQVWHKLAWMDPDRLIADPGLAALVARDREFSEADKVTLRGVELALMAAVVPEYRAAAARGQVELAASPFYHPILPLLCDSEAHRRAHPEAVLPRHRFQRPEDARLQVRRALAFHQSRFGECPRGMWPSEGSVSDETIAILAEAGLTWVATDEDILSRSLGQPMRPELLYRPYRLRDGAGPVALFRDHGLSDLIGFHYQSWEATAAAQDFVARVREAGRRYGEATGGAVATVSVILDGENAWEHYAGGGRPFLRALYGALEGATDIQTVTMTEAAAAADATLPSIYPGSWIHSDFWIWMGHADDHRAWDQLWEARATFDARAESVSPEARDRALEEILIAEGSDWFWWYGDDHSSDHDAEFDDLFRRHLRNAYAALAAPMPDALFATNITTGPGRQRLEPSGVLAITLDGRESSFVEWVGAVTPSLVRAGGTMHQIAESTLVAEVRVGLSSTALCLRLDGSTLVARVSAGSASLALVLAGPRIRVIPIRRQWMACDAVIEVAIPCVEFGDQDEIEFSLQVRGTDDGVLETVPHGRTWVVGRAVAPGL